MISGFSDRDVDEDFPGFKRFCVIESNEQTYIVLFQADDRAIGDTKFLKC
jgi:hypothetical protein